MKKLSLKDQLDQYKTQCMKQREEIRRLRGKLEGQADGLKQMSGIMDAVLCQVVLEHGKDGALVISPPTPLLLDQWEVRTQRTDGFAEYRITVTSKEK